MVKIGVISDTHADKAGALPHVLRELIEVHKVKAICHCGDIEEQHLDPQLFRGLRVICALNDEQLQKPAFRNPPPNWTFTFPKNRIRDLFHVRFYVGHKRSSDLLSGSETDFRRVIDELRKKYDGLRYVLSGHTHHQVLFRTQLVRFVNPGAIEYTLDGYEYAVIDTENDQVIFGRIPETKPSIKPFSVGIISDPLNIAKFDPDFWRKLREEFRIRNVGHVIICDNIATSDIGKEGFEDLDVHFCPRQRVPGRIPDNWQLVQREKPIVKIGDYQFFVHHDLARILLEESEVEMGKECLKILEKHPEVNFILYGGSDEAFLMGGHRARIINPGGAILNRSFATVYLPSTQMTFGHVPLNPLPVLAV